MTESDDLDPAEIIENRFKDDKLGREVRVVREMEGILSRTYIEVMDDNGVWKNFKEWQDEIDG